MSSWSASAGTSLWSNYTSQGLSGAISVASGMVSAVSSSTPAQWVSSSVKVSLLGQEPEKLVGRDQVVWIGFDMDDGAPSQPQFLCMCFVNGFQIWQVLDAVTLDEQGARDLPSVATRETQPLREIVSVRQGPTRMIKLLPSVAPMVGGFLDGRQPALAVVPDESGDLNKVRIYSLVDSDYIHSLRFHGEVHGIMTNRSFMVVALKNQLLLHSLACDLSIAHSFNTFPSPSNHGVLALGPRWLAYPSNQPLSCHAGGDEPRPNSGKTYASTVLDVGMGVAGTVASSAVHLGGRGLRALGNYLSSSPTTDPAIEPSLSEYAGTVLVRDLDQSCGAFHHFRAHSSPISLMRCATLHLAQCSTGFVASLVSAGRKAPPSAPVSTAVVSYP